MLKRQFQVAALCFVAAAAFGQGNGLRIDTMTSWQIVCAHGAIESEVYAAEEFQTLFAEMTGTTLPVVASASGDRGAVFIGPDAVAQSQQSAPLSDAGKETLRVQVTADAVFIDGGRPRGTLYGVYEFFEELCGVRFLTHDHTWYPDDAEDKTLPFGVHVYEPVFAYRLVSYGEIRRNPEFATRLRNNAVTRDARLGGRTGYERVGHTMARLVSPEEYGAEHPEYFALVDGERRLEASYDRPQLCMTNPDVVALMTEALLEQIAQQPDMISFGVGHSDNQDYCTCDGCAAINEREGSAAGATIHFVNQVAERVEQEYPDVLVGTYAYQYTRKPPATIRPRRNVQMQLCSIEACNFHPINDPTCPLNKPFTEDMDGWRRKTDNIKVWHYNTNFWRGYMLPYPNFRSIGPSVAYYADNAVIGIYMQAAGNAMAAEFSDMRAYVISRCLWKPGRDGWAEMETFCRLHYGAAAETIIEYLTWYHDLVADAGAHPTCFATESELQINPETARRIMAYFQRALEQAESEKVRVRVEKASLCAYRAALSASGMRLVCEDGVARPDLEGFHPELLDRFAMLCERHGVTMEDEHTPIGEYIESLRSLHEGYKAVTLENDLWRLVILPESNAKIVEIIHKPSGRNVIQPRRAFDRFRFEEWTRQGDGPAARNIVAFEADADPDVACLTLELDDGATLTRRVALDGDAIRFETRLTAADQRPFDFWVHPEYDPAATTDDPRTVAVYVKAPEWTWINRDWRDGQPTEQQTRALREAAAGGAFAFYNHEAGFGVEQRFTPEDYETLHLYWNPTRQQLNLEMYPKTALLAPGEQKEYAWELRYLDVPPDTR